MKIKFEKKRFFVALVCAAFAFLLTLLIYNHRDFLLDREFTKGVGKFQQEVNPTLKKNAEDFIQSKLARAKEVCVSEWIGRDEGFVYMGVGCAEFSESMGNVLAVGDQNYHPTRFRYDGNEVEDFEQPDESNFNYSVRSLFPKSAFQWFRIQTNSEKFLKKGWEKTQILRDRNS
jgi:hypothetical protein